MLGSLGVSLLLAAACAQGTTADDGFVAVPDGDGGKEPSRISTPGPSDPANPDGAGTDGGSNPNVSPACKAALESARFDFDTTAQGWTTKISDGVTQSQDSDWPFNPWTHGNSSYKTACAAGQCWGAELSQNYAQCQRGEIVSPKIDLSACKGQSVTLTFKHAWAFWDDGTNFDGGIVEVSSNDGGSWQVPTGTYPGTLKIRGAAFGLSCVDSGKFHIHNKPGFTKKQPTTSTFEVAIPDALLTDSVRVRFSSGSGINYNGTSATTSRNATDFGWRVDDVAFVAK